MKIIQKVHNKKHQTIRIIAYTGLSTVTDYRTNGLSNYRANRLGFGLRLELGVQYSLLGR